MPVSLEAELHLDQLMIMMMTAESSFVNELYSCAFRLMMMDPIAAIQGTVPAGLRLRAAGRRRKGLLWITLCGSPQAEEMVRLYQIDRQSSQRYVSPRSAHLRHIKQTAQLFSLLVALTFASNSLLVDDSSRQMSIV